MVNIVEIRGFVFWVPPEPGRLMTRAALHEGIQNELFLRGTSIFGAIGDLHDTIKGTKKQTNEVRLSKLRNGVDGYRKVIGLHSKWEKA